jgi:hypothetical protein
VRSSLALWATVLAGFGLAACGGGGSTADDSPSPEEEAKVAAVRAVENGDAATFCRAQVSEAYIARIYGGDVGKCVDAEGAVPEAAGKAKASAAVVRPDGRHATVTVSIEGGSLDGSAGDVAMVKEEGAWKVDDYADDFIRSAFLASIRTTDEGAVSTPEMKACFSRQVKQLPAATIRHLTYASDADEQKAMNASLLKMAKKCPESALAEYGARTLTEGLHPKKGVHKAGYVKCLHKEIHFLLEVTGLTSELLVEHPNFAAVAALDGIVEGAKKNCGG